MSLIGNFNKIVQKIGTALILDDEFNKFLFYSDKENTDTKDISELDKLDDPINMIKNKYFFFNRRVNTILQKSKACGFIRFNGLYPARGSNIEEVILEIGVISPVRYIETYNGNRLLCLVHAAQRIIDNTREIGRAKITNISPIRDVTTEYEGYIIYLSITDYNSVRFDNEE